MRWLNRKVPTFISMAAIMVVFTVTGYAENLFLTDGEVCTDMATEPGASDILTDDGENDSSEEENGLLIRENDFMPDEPGENLIQSEELLIQRMEAENNIPITPVVYESGQCGDHLTWILVDAELTISGTGDMWDWEVTSPAPWDSRRKLITEVVIEDEVTSIGNDAFFQCEDLIRIEIPDSVTRIGDNAFNNCGSLTSITIPDNVASIGMGAFRYCGSLPEVTIPDSVTGIGDFAFEKCQKLADITIGSGMISIGNSLFKECSGLKNVMIPDRVTNIDSYAFYGCGRLENITIPNSVTRIGDYAFSYCDDLTSLVIPDSVESIGVDAFYDCRMIADLTIGNNVTSIGEHAFAQCWRLKSVTVPESVTDIGIAAFGGCRSLISINVAINNPVYSSDEGVLFNKNKTQLILCPGGKNGEYSVPDTVVSFGDSAFDSCIKLTSVTIGDGVTDIGNWTFAFCDNLTNVVIPESVTSIGDNVFFSCRSLMNITIPDSVTSIGESAFYDCGSLSSITIPDSVISIGPGAFFVCPGLTIYGGKGSFMEAYAELNKTKFEQMNIQFVPLSPTPGFYDVADSKKFFYNPIYWAVGKNITTGYKTNGVPNGLFGPNDKCTREQIVTFLWRMMGSPKPTTRANFLDVKSGYYLDAVSWALENGITTGISSDKFGVGDDCSRAMCVTFLYRTAGTPEVTSGSIFTDVPDGKWFSKAVTWAAEKEITTGYKDSAGNPTGKFGLNDPCKRGEIVTFLYRFAHLNQ